jgi:hypothetical protein
MKRMYRIGRRSKLWKEVKTNLFDPVYFLDRIEPLGRSAENHR